MTERPDLQVDAILDRLAELTEDDAFVLADAWQQEDEAVRRRAWSKVKSSLKRDRRERALDEARAAVSRWAAAGRSDFHGIDGLLGRPGESTNARYGAAPAILDAVAARMAVDALDEEEFDVLWRPWLSLDEIGPGDSS